ncbi:carbohydrate kinase family protein [Candidatus Woesearchaeota archaeon]|nr:carbohydrate kinase family protein [Candidatus Woesearchaeota archaeon]
MVYDIITVGSATIDIFLKTKSKDVEIEEIHHHKDICMPIGAKILVNDLYTDTGGGGTNCGVAFARMGLKTGWIGKIGQDLNSRTVLRQMEEEKVNFLGGQAKGSTGLSVILTGFDKNRTILAYKGTNDELNYSEITKARTKWYYMSSMRGKSWTTAIRIAKDAKKKKIPIAFNPSLYTAEAGIRKLKPILEATRILVLNKEEAQALSSKKKGYLEKLQEIVPLVVVTDGPKGATAYNGIKKYCLKIPKQRIVETTGAGDSFAAGFVASVIKGEDIPTAMLNGYKQAESVIQHYGAKNNLLTWAQIKKKTKAKVIEC